ncbi:MAG TPA: carboxymuconolactone decarboxylase [Acidimicrobiaceae bacterium]|nr:carboxymuconolactone decarboxylase [Acidimicrobiaceae bacterium]
MAHVTLLERPHGVIGRLAFAYSRRRFGRLVEPAMAAAHHRGVLVAMGALEAVAGAGWRRLDPGLRWLAIQLTSARIGCSWCLDYGYYESQQNEMDPAKIRDVANWRDSELYDERERAVLEYAELATATPVAVAGEVMSSLRRHLSEAEVVELASWVALENYRSRFNGGLGLKSQGFADECAVPVAAAVASGRR